MGTELNILQEIAQRKSVRAFLPRAIELEKLKALWAAGRWAPSSGNLQDWHHYAFLGQAVQQLKPAINRGNHWLLAAPLVVGSTRDASLKNTTESRNYGMYDVALSVMSMVLEAEHLGLRAHQIAGFRETELKKILSLPAHEELVVVTAFGYEGSIESLDDRTKAKEMSKKRERKPLDQVVTVVTE